MQKPRGPDKRENLGIQKPKGPDNHQQNEENSGYAKTQASWQSLLIVLAYEARHYQHNWVPSRCSIALNVTAHNPKSLTWGLGPAPCQSVQSRGPASCSLAPCEGSKAAQNGLPLCAFCFGD